MQPTLASIATGSDALQALHPATTLNVYRHVFIYNKGGAVNKHDALVVFGDVSAHAVPIKGGEWVQLNDVELRCTIKAINLVAGSNFENLHVSVW